MDVELKAKWVTALRSKKYLQANGRLRAGEGYCCLGVLCDVSGAGEWRLFDKDWAYVIDDDGYPSPHETELPRAVASIGDREHALIEMNDQTDASFHKIADYIEANL